MESWRNERKKKRKEKNGSKCDRREVEGNWDKEEMRKLKESRKKGNRGNEKK